MGSRNGLIPAPIRLCEGTSVLVEPDFSTLRGLSQPPLDVYRKLQGPRPSVPSIEQVVAGCVGDRPCDVIREDTPVGLGRDSVPQVGVVADDRVGPVLPLETLGVRDESQSQN